MKTAGENAMDLKRIFDRDVISILELLDINTGETTSLQRFDYLIEAPSFRSEDEIIFNSRGHIFSYRISSQSLSEVNTGYCVNCNNDHVLSPDKTKIAVSHQTQEDWQSRIYIIDLTGKQPPRLITPMAPSYLHGWSPDGATLAYCAERDSEYDIYTIPADGGCEKRLTATHGLNDGPEYSSDGNYLYFNSVRNGLMDCYRMKTDGTSVFRLTDNGRSNWFPHISPDQKTVAYISYDPKEVAAGDHPANKHVEIRAVNPDGTNDRAILKFFGGQGSLNVNSWMPDSVHLAFVRYELKTK